MVDISSLLSAKTGSTTVRLTSAIYPTSTTLPPTSSTTTIPAIATKIPNPIFPFAYPLCTDPLYLSQVPCWTPTHLLLWDIPSFSSFLTSPRSAFGWLGLFLLDNLTNPHAWPLWLAVFIVGFCIYMADQYRRHANIQRDKAKDVREKWMKCWTSRSWPEFYALVELYALGEIPWGPWDRGDMGFPESKDDVSTSFATTGQQIRIEKNALVDQEVLRELCRMGIIPLNMRLGGLRTYRVPLTELEKRNALKKDMGFWAVAMPWILYTIDPFYLRNLWPTRFHVQSKRRATFDFLVPLPWGFKEPQKESERRHQKRLEHFAYLLSLQGLPFTEIWRPVFDHDDPHGWQKHQGVNNMHLRRHDLLPLEVGARSRWRYLLPFFKDSWLEGKIGFPENSSVNKFLRRRNSAPLIEKNVYFVVHMETPEYRDETWLEHEVLRMARVAKLRPLRNDQDLNFYLRRCLHRYGVTDFDVDSVFPLEERTGQEGGDGEGEGSGVEALVQTGAAQIQPSRITQTEPSQRYTTTPKGFVVPRLRGG
ncbi:hypothetical protein P154DRAFT_294616 [Amniculicola lignicola CBS 123094]|uniref:Uncharacterized protein n=1 Tax=Amniculicola lignicola CBS 123094 TaxID=1392246 RepID=A0A6A5W869_9PLEO|nr:hypothetical protein P154DRAFT_294616 [Amniculicola lignicola CBS 123094]